MSTPVHIPHHGTERRSVPTMGQRVAIVLLAFGLGVVAAPATAGMAMAVSGLGGN